MGPGAEVGELLFHGAGEGDAVAEGGEEVVFGEVSLFVEGFVKGAVDGFLDFGAAEVFAGGGEFGDGERFWIAGAAAKMDGEDLFALSGVGKIDEEDFVEAAFA